MTLEKHFSNKFCPKCPKEKTFSRFEKLCSEHLVRLSLPDPYRLIGHLVNNKYQIEALLGIGGMGVVYLATHIGISRHVALKILKPDLITTDPSILKSFRREAIISGRLIHPNIVNVTDADVTSDGLAFMVMELLECPTLEDELVQTPVFPVKRVEFLLKQICDALQAAHNSQIIHRDLKPSNIAVLCTSDEIEIVKVLDFGIAKSFSDGVAKVSQAMGTPVYASPEQFMLGDTIDLRSDIYSLGVLIYQMLTGRVPFQGKTVGEIVKHHLSSPPTSMRIYQENISEELNAVVLKALAKDPKDRPSSAEEFFNLFKMAVLGNVTSNLKENSATSYKNLPQNLSNLETVSEEKFSTSFYKNFPVDFPNLKTVSDIQALTSESEQIHSNQKNFSTVPAPTNQIPFYIIPSSSVRKKNILPTAILIFVITIFGIGGIFFIAKVNSEKKISPGNFDKPIAINKINSSSYEDSFHHVSQRIKFATENIFLGRFSSSGEIISVREQVNSSRTVVANSLNEFSKAEAGDQIQSFHNQLKFGYETLITSLDNYSTSLRSYEFALQNREYNVGESEQERGAVERIQIEKDQSALRMALDDVRMYEEKLSNSLDNNPGK